MSARERLARVAVDAVALPSIVARHLVSDPGMFGAQLSRRFSGLRRVLAPGPTAEPSLVNGIRWFLVDEPDKCRDALAQPPRTRFGRALADELLLQLGERPHGRGRPAARAEAYRGELTEAISLAGPSLLRRMWRDEASLLAPGARLRRLPTVAWPRVPGPRVFFTLTNSLPHTHSGYTARTHHLLRALQATGVELEAVTRIGYPATVGRLGAANVDVVDGVTYRRIPSARYPWRLGERLTVQASETRAMLARFRPTVLHTTTDYTNALITDALARSAGLPWIYELRGQLELSWAASRQGSAAADAAHSERVQLLRAKESELARRADAVIVLSEVQRDDMVSRGVAAESIHVIGNSVSDEVLARVRCSPAAARDALGMPTDGLWVGSVTSVVDYEGLDTLLRAVAQVRGDGLDVRCAIVGDGVARPGLRALADELGLGEAAQFPGRVPSEQALRWHEALDVFAVPRKDTPVCRAVTPLKPLEAMALGRPILASDLPALREIVADVNAGICVESGNVSAFSEALASLATDVDRRDELANGGRQFARSRTWSRAADRLASLYRTMEGT